MVLRLNRVNLNWESKPLQSWFGSSLKYLCLSHGLGSIASSPSFIEMPIEALHSILSRCGVLRRLRIEGVSVIKSSTSPFAFDLSELSLKNLEILELISMPHLGHGVFAKLSAPNLKSLDVLLSSTNIYERQAALIHLSYFLEASGSSLKELLIVDRGETLEMNSSSDLERTRTFDRSLALASLERLDLELSGKGSRGLRELIYQLQLPKVKKVFHASSPEGDQMSTQALAASSLSVESIAIGPSFYYSSRFSSQSVSTVKKFEGSELPTFSNLKYLDISKDSIFFLDFFSRSQTGELQEIAVTLEYEDEETKSSVFQDLMRLLSSNRLSLIKVCIQRWPMNKDETTTSPRFIKYESDFKLIKQINEKPIEFSKLKSLTVEACNPLLQIFQSCLTPSLSRVDFSHLTRHCHGGERSVTGDEFRDYDEKVEFKREEEYIQRTEKEQHAEVSDSDEEDYGDKRERERQREAEIDQEQKEAKRSSDWI